MITAKRPIFDVIVANPREIWFKCENAEGVYSAYVTEINVTEIGDVRTTTLVFVGDEAVPIDTIDMPEGVAEFRDSLMVAARPR